MNYANTVIAESASHNEGYGRLHNGCVEGVDPTALTGIFDDEVQIAVWKRNLSDSLGEAVAALISADPDHRRVATVSPTEALTALDEISETGSEELAENIAELVEMFCYLFELKRVGLRTSVLSAAMCPRFHVDRIPCRLVTSYHGPGTEWLSPDKVDRSKIGRRSNDLNDIESGVYRHENDIQRLQSGDVALLKGEQWQGNAGKGLVHRSPALTDTKTADNLGNIPSVRATGERRFFLSIDFSD